MRTEEKPVRTKCSSRPGMQVSDDVHARLLNSLHSTKIVHGFTHRFYRYPARFSPEFARSVIQAFSKPGDTILDPFMGGGTTIVEGLARGRKVVGIDINSLAVFIARVKSTPLSSSELARVRRLIKQVYKYPPHVVGIQSQAKLEVLFKDVPWWIRNCILMILGEIKSVRNPKILDFLRCGLLKTAQWALDCREAIPTSWQFIRTFCTNIFEMCDQIEEYSLALRSEGIPSDQHVSRYRRFLLRSAVNVDQDRRIPSDWLPIKLVVASPPYPGVHVLYHRWQVRGRRETPAPFAIINNQDGHFSSFYTFGDHRRVEPYFETLTAVYQSIANLLARSSLVIQLVSFANPQRDVDRFLNAMDQAGFDECSLKEVGLGTEKRVWRSVPNRKWYAGYRDGLQSGRELLLFHRIKRV